VKQIAVFTAATESFAKANIGMSIGDSLKEFAQVVREAKKAKIQVRGYVSTAFGCPFEGKVAPKKALKVVEALADLGVSQVSIGDTIGVATPKDIDLVMKPALKLLGSKKVAGHFHDTRGTALANALRSIELGVRTLDSSAGGLGGCPFAPGATGNLATEDLVYMLDGMGEKTGIDLAKLCATSLELSRKMKRPISSRYLQAYAARC
jgi:hydroxymethylglutaryl-CoA lyase